MFAWSGPFNEPMPSEPVTNEFAVKAPMVPFCAKRFVELEIFVKKFVVVAAVPVALTKVTFWRVVEPEARILTNVVRPAKDDL